MFDRNTPPCAGLVLPFLSSPLSASFSVLLAVVVSRNKANLALGVEIDSGSKRGGIGREQQDHQLLASPPPVAYSLLATASPLLHIKGSVATTHTPSEYADVTAEKAASRFGCPRSWRG